MIKPPASLTKRQKIVFILAESISTNPPLTLNEVADSILAIENSQNKMEAAAPEMYDLFKEIDEYLSPNPKNYVGCRSILHSKIISILAKIDGGA